jgi:hypothetical protein
MKPIADGMPGDALAPDAGTPTDLWVSNNADGKLLLNDEVDKNCMITIVTHFFCAALVEWSTTKSRPTLYCADGGNTVDCKIF